MSQKPAIRDAIAAMGAELTPALLPSVRALFLDEQQALADQHSPLATDLSYGAHPRQKLDLYAEQGSKDLRPIFLWVHGGGFVAGEKSAPDHPYSAHMGRFAARHGYLGAVMNYRLAPEHQWPSGADDVAAALDWLKLNGSTHGGDTSRIILAGTSAGAAHIADLLTDPHSEESLCGVILLSGIYGFTPIEDRDRVYYGKTSAPDTRKKTAARLTATNIPLFLGCAEFDPPRFQKETLCAQMGQLEQNGHMPKSHLAAGHNHYSVSFHIGTSDRRLSDEMLHFMQDCIG